ncbi:Ku protein [Variovorax sp. J22P240]|uniref:non-homologous end joining protein Ku n=1 Tax=Variovorax sp. J22P240 TaxID=3053514 RepID=UPI00257591AC|nr:Ku protein [Variovorax sp. J22P240]MDM0002757.1 Ku protein [Variovorax sp. J22P240]
MAARSIASLSLSFGLVSIPVKLYSATESSETIRFNLLTKDGSRVKQQYVSEKDMKTVVPRSEMIKGYEFEKDQYVLFEPEELKALEEDASHVIDIVAFIPEKEVDPLYYDKAYFLAPDKRGGKPYSLLRAAMRESGRCALAKWAWKGKQYVVQVRAAEDGLVLQQLLYANEVRSLEDLDIELTEPTPAELKLALQLIDQISQDSYDPTMFEDEEKKRILAAIDAKIAGQEVVASPHAGGEETSGQVIDLTAALMASLKRSPASATKSPPPAGKTATGNNVSAMGKERKGVRRAPKTEVAEPVAAPAHSRARK